MASLFLAGHPALASVAESQVHVLENALLHVLLQVAVVILCARGLGLLSLRLGQPRVVGEIVGGLLLGPSLLGRTSPEFFDWLFHQGDPHALYWFSQVGLLLLMLQIGMEFDFSHLRARGNGRRVALTAAGSLLVPLAGGFVLGQVMHPRLAQSIDPLHFSLFCAVAIAITALPILGRIMMDFGISRTPLGSITISCAAINDVVGWVLLAVVSTLASSRFSAEGLALQVFGILVFAGASWLILRPLLLRLAAGMRTRHGDLSLDGAGLIVAAAFLCGIVTIKLGIFAIFGGFAVGVLLHSDRWLVDRWQAKLAPFVEFFFLPIFFTYTGLRTDAASLSFDRWGWWLLVLLVAIGTKLIGSWAGARLAGIDARDSASIAVMMNTRALMELIVLNVGRDLGVIPPDVFTMLVLMAIVTTIMTSPLLRRLLLSPPKPEPAALRE